MKRKLALVLIMFISLGVFLMCDSGKDSDKDKDDDSTDIDEIAIEITSAIVESLPQIKELTRTVTTGTIRDHEILRKLFKLECYMEGTFDFCPKGIDATTGGNSNPYKLSSSTLIGSIAHAQMYSGGLQQACDGTETDVTASNLKAAESGGDPAKFVLDYYDLLGCIPDKNMDMYQTYSVDPDKSYQATLTTRYRVPNDGDADPGQNDIFQVYVSIKDEKTPTFLAYNYAGADSMLQRTVLLVNVAEHKFAIKHIEPMSDGTIKNVIAIGVGGIDIETGEFNSGSFYTKFITNIADEEDGCVDNATGNFEADNSKCTAASVPVTWTSSDAVATYLGMSDEEKTRLSAFLASFKTEAFLTAEDAPKNTTTDVEQNMPKEILP